MVGALACGSDPAPPDGGAAADAGMTADLGPADGGGERDLGLEDVGLEDAGAEDLGVDGGAPDGGEDGGTADGGGVFEPCPALPEASGTVVRLGPADVRRLTQVVREAEAGTTILLEDGTYTLGAGDGRLRFHRPGVQLRGASGDAQRVIIDASYAVDTLVWITTSDVLVADLTLTHAIDHLVHITAAGDASENPTGVRLYRLRLLDGGEQFVKANSNGADTAFPDQGRVECSHFELTDEGRPHIERNPGGCYTGGIDVHEGWGWTVRYNRFQDIYCAGEGLAEHAVHFWRGARDTVVENNTIVDCARGIGFGLLEQGAGRTYDPDPYPGVAPIGHFGGTIRNNVIYAQIPWYDTGIELQQAHDVDVVHNTVVSEASASRFYTSIDYRFANTLARVVNNLARRITVRNGGQATRMTNVEGASPELLVDPAGGDFHLSPDATEALGTGTALSDPGLDMDGQAPGATPDIGADQR